MDAVQRQYIHIFVFHLTEIWKWMPEKVDVAHVRVRLMPFQETRYYLIFVFRGVNFVKVFCHF